MLPAAHGDCLWLEYGSRGATHRVLIDGGTTSTSGAIRQRIMALPERSRHFELLIVTHVDADHIGGILSLLRDPPEGVSFGDVWFNGFAHLEAATCETGARGALQGEALSELLTGRDGPWNAAFGSAYIAVADEGALPEHTLPGGLRLTLLSPTRQELIDLRPRWAAEVRRAGLTPGGNVPPNEQERRLPRAPEESRRGGLDPIALASTASRPDAGEPNGSSIAVLAEFGGRSVLLTGDAFASTLEHSLRRLLIARGGHQLTVDAFKLPHHGSQGNVSRTLLELVRCPRYLVSTNGSRFGHPDAEAIARVLVHGGRRKTLYFNYRSAISNAWGRQPQLEEQFGYRAAFPGRGAAGTRLAL